MNREIKFRAYNTMVGRMQYFDLPEIEKQSGKIQWHILKIMQYTGLKDKASKEVYEGDILQCYYGGDKIGAKEVVEFKNGSYWLPRRDISLNQWLEDDGVYSSGIKVIGNIYENQNLLNT